MAGGGTSQIVNQSSEMNFEMYNFTSYKLLLYDHFQIHQGLFIATDNFTMKLILFHYPVGRLSIVFNGLLIVLLEVMLEISVSKVRGKP